MYNIHRKGVMKMKKQAYVNLVSKDNPLPVSCSSVSGLLCTYRDPLHKGEILGR